MQKTDHWNLSSLRIAANSNFELKKVRFSPRDFLPVLNNHRSLAKSRKRSQSMSENEQQDDHSSHPKSKKHRRHKKSEDAETPLDNAPVKETDEEYDARLEREEQERLQAARKKELKRIKERSENGLRSKDGVRFKGMLYISRMFCCSY